MTDLSCSVSACENYKSGRCCRPDIVVAGPDACFARETCCADYQSRAEGAASDSAADETPNPEPEVRCEAVNCTHNRSSCCSAGHIDIRTVSAGGGRVKTECSAFHSDDE